MSKVVRMILSIAVLLFFFPVNVVNAMENNYGDLISVRTYTDDDGITVTEKIYFKSDDKSGLSLSDTSGNGWFTNEKTYTWNDGSVMTYFAQGYFIWGNGDVNVDSSAGGIDGQSNKVTLSNKQLTSGKGKYAQVFNNFAYVKLSFTAQYLDEQEKNFEVMIRVSESGNVI